MAQKRSTSRATITNRVADFETTTDPNDCRVWAWASIAVDDLSDYVYGTDMESFMAYLDKAPTVTYFHNLAFDGSFIADYLLRNGYRWVADSPGNGEFTSLISNMGKWYSLTVITHAGVRTEFRDSLKKLPLSVAAIAKAFNLEDQKLEIDYHSPRPVGHVLTEQEQAYLRNDVAIVARALRLQFNTGMKKLTVGADALNEFKNVISKKEFTRTFPVLPAEMDHEIRKAYRGGFTYADPRFSKRVQGAGLVFDVNSLYPSVMYDRPIPCGMPKWVEGMPPSDKLFIVSMTFTAKIKPNHIPCIQVKNSFYFNATEYLSEISEPITMSVTSVDLRLWQDQYDINIIAVHGAFVFDSVSGIFQPYIDKWMNVKANSKGGMRQIAKLHLNSLYGKFATNTNVTGKRPVMKDNVITLVTGQPEERNPVYTAAGVFITAYARDVTIRAAQAVYPRFMYADTDSLHLLGADVPSDVLRVHPTDLGAWKHESTFTEGVYIRAKQYVEHLDSGEYSAHVAGLPEPIASQLTIEDVLTSRVFHGKLMPRRVPGGTVLTETTFTLTVD